MSKFKPGEIAIYAPGPDARIKGKAGHGAECEVHSKFNLMTMNLYWCIFPGDPSPAPGGMWIVEESELRKKPPPAGSWEEIEVKTNWNPTKERIDEARND